MLKQTAARYAAFTLFTIFSTFVLLSCRQEFNTVRPGWNGDIPAIPGTLTVHFILGGAETGTRTVRPSFSASSFQKLSVKLYHGDALLDEQVIDRTADTDTGGLASNVRFEIAGGGTYTLEAEGYRLVSDTVPLVRGRGVKVISETDLDHGVVFMVGLALTSEAQASGGTGSIDLALNWPSSGGIILNTTLYQLDMSTVVQEQSGITARPAALSFEGIPAGTYYLALEFKRGTVTAGYFIEAVTVLPGLSANRWFGINGEEQSSRTITVDELRDSAVNVQSVRIFKQNPAYEIALSNGGTDGLYWPTTESGGVTGILRLEVACLGGQAISPLAWSRNAGTEQFVQAVPTIAQYVYAFDIPDGTPFPTMRFTIYSADGSDEKVYTIYPTEPAVKLELAGGAVSYHWTLPSAVGQINDGAAGTITLLKPVLNNTHFAGQPSISIVNKSVTVTTGAASATIKPEIAYRATPLFDISGGGHVILRGTPEAPLVLDGTSSGNPNSELITLAGTNTRLTMEANVFLQNNRNQAAAVHAAGAVRAASNARFTMNGGTIQNNYGQHGGAVLVESGAVFTMTGGTIQNNDCYAWKAGAVLVRGGSRFAFQGGSIGGTGNVYSQWNSQTRKAAIFVDFDSSGQGVLSMQGTATVDTSDIICLEHYGSSMPYIEVPVSFEGGAAILPQKIQAGTVVLRGAGLTESGLGRFSVAAPAESWLAYEAGNPPVTPPEGRLARTYYINDTVTYSSNAAGTAADPCVSPRHALENVLDSGTARFVFMGMVNAYMTKTPAAVAGGGTVPVWIHVTGQRKLIFSGSGTGISGYNGNSTHGNGNHPALWITGGSRVTLKDGMEIRGDSNVVGGQPISLATVYNGTLSIEDTAQVVTSTTDGGKTIGIRPGNGKIQVDTPLQQTAPMYIRPLNTAAQGILPSTIVGEAVAQGSLVASASQWFHFQEAGYVIGATGHIQAAAP